MRKTPYINSGLHMQVHTCACTSPIHTHKYENICLYPQKSLKSTKPSLIICCGQVPLLHAKVQRVLASLSQLSETQPSRRITSHYQVIYREEGVSTGALKRILKVQFFWKGKYSLNSMSSLLSPGIDRAAYVCGHLGRNNGGEFFERKIQKWKYFVANESLGSEEAPVFPDVWGWPPASSIWTWKEAWRSPSLSPL